MNRREITTGLLAAATWPAVFALSGCATRPPEANASNRVDTWQALPTERFQGKQDDIDFIDAATAWYVNGDGKIYKTSDGGQQWKLLLTQRGTCFRRHRPSANEPSSVASAATTAAVTSTVRTA